MRDLILIHGAIGASDHMKPLGGLMSKDFNVHYLELDGHGKNSNADIPFTMDHFTNQLGSLIDKIGKEVHIFGYSMGGFIALLRAQRDERIKSIFTLGTKLSWNPEIASREVKMVNPEKIEEKVPAFAQVLASRHGSDHWKDVLNNTAKLLVSLGEANPINQDSMKQVTCPVHLCLADQDEMVTWEETELVAGMISNAVTSRLENSKHPIEKVDLPALANKIVSFVSTAKET